MSPLYRNSHREDPPFCKLKERCHEHACKDRRRCRALVLFSLLDGATRIDELVDACKGMGMPASENVLTGLVRVTEKVSLPSTSVSLVRGIP